MNGLDKKSFWSNFWRVNNDIRRIRVKEQQKNPQSIKLGVWAIILCGISLLLSYGTAWLTIKLWVWAFTLNAAIIGNLMLIVLAVALPFFYIQMIVAPCLLLPIHQLIINRKAIGWISLIIGIATIIASVIGVFAFILHIIGVISIF